MGPAASPHLHDTTTSGGVTWDANEPLGRRIKSHTHDYRVDREVLPRELVQSWSRRVLIVQTHTLFPPRRQLAFNEDEEEAESDEAYELELVERKRHADCPAPKGARGVSRGC